MEAVKPKRLEAKQLYRILWRWHFYAGVFAIPFVIILSITGAIYLFKPQVDAFNNSPYQNLALTGARTTADQQLQAALAAVPNSTLSAYELPRSATDAVQILVNQDREKMRVYVHPHTLQILHIKNDQSGIMKLAHDIHGELLLGKIGSLLVELAASWVIVLVLTGIYLWWPRNAKGLAGVLYPRLSYKARVFWKDLHAVVGMWLSFLVLFLLVSGLPWALVWGSAFKEVRQITGSLNRPQDWVIAGRHQDHAEHNEHLGAQVIGLLSEVANLQTIIDRAQDLKFAAPVLVMPPVKNKPTGGSSWMKGSSKNWSVKSLAQNRPLRADAEIDAKTADVVSRTDFSQRHLIDRIVGIGVAAHEGQLFGWFNQLLGLLTSIGLLVLCVSGFFMWRKRKPQDALGAPPSIPDAKLGYGFIAIIVITAVLLPVLAGSLVVIFIVEYIILKRWVTAQKWLGC